MSYPYDKTYLEKIQENPEECEAITEAYRILRKKWLVEHPETDDISIPLKEEFAILGEAFDLASYEVGDISDQYHFMWDVLDALLTSKEEK